MKANQRSRRQRHRFAGVTLMHYKPTLTEMLRESMGFNRRSPFRLRPYQTRTLRDMLNKMPPMRVHDSSLVEFQSRARAMRDNQLPLIIHPSKAIEQLDGSIRTLLGKKRALVSGVQLKIDMSTATFAPMQGDLTKGWSIVDEATHANKENDNGKAD